MRWCCELVEKETLAKEDLERILAPVRKRPPHNTFTGFGKRTPSDRPPIEIPLSARSNGSSTNGVGQTAMPGVQPQPDATAPVAPMPQPGTSVVDGSPRRPARTTGRVATTASTQEFGAAQDFGQTRSSGRPRPTARRSPSASRPPRTCRTCRRLRRPPIPATRSAPASGDGRLAGPGVSAAPGAQRAPRGNGDAHVES